MAITWEELRNADPGQDMGSFPRNVARAAKDAICSINGLYPDWYISQGFGGPMGDPLSNDLCRRNKPPASAPPRQGQALGGQCPVRYNAVVTHYGVKNDNTDYTSGPQTLNINALGPMSWSWRIDSSGGAPSTSVVEIKNAAGQIVSTSLSAGALKNVFAPNVSFSRVDGQADSCGDGPKPPVVVPPAGPLFIPTPVPTPRGPIILPLVIPVGVFISPKIQVQISPTVNLNIGPNKVEFSPNFNINPTFDRPSGEPQLPPGQPQRPSVQPDKDDSSGKCPDPCPPAIEYESITVKVGKCTRDSGEWKFSKEDQTFQVNKKEKDAWLREFEQLLPLTRDECFRRNSRKGGNPAVLGVGTSSIAQRTVYVALPPEVLSVYLDIVGPLPKGLSLYSLQSSNEEQGKIGNIALALAGGPSSGGYQVADPGWIWMRRTWLEVGEKGTKDRSVRVHLRPDISWALYDSGERLPNKDYQ